MTMTIQDMLKGYSCSRDYYVITVTAPTLSETEATTVEKLGFIDPMKAWEYTNFDETVGTLADYERKGRGYIRWRQLALDLSQFGVFYMNVNTIEGGTATATPTSVKFTMGYEQTDAMFCEVDASEYVAGDDEIEKLRDGRVIFKGIKCLKRIIANRLLSSYSSFVTIYDPTINDISKSPSRKPYGMRDEKLAVNSCAPASYTVAQMEANIAITKVDDPLFA